MELDKNYLIGRFEDFISKAGYDSSIKNNYSSPNSKQKEYSNFEILKKILSLYEFILDESKILIRRNYIHSDKDYEKKYNLLRNYISNKLRIDNKGDIYININNKVTFNGEKDHYEEWFINDKRKLNTIVREVIKELNQLLGGDPIEDRNKPFLKDFKECANYICNFIPVEYLLECSRGNFYNFNRRLPDILRNLNLSESIIDDFIVEFRNNLAFHERFNNE